MLYLSFSRFPPVATDSRGGFSFPGIREWENSFPDSREITGNPGKQSVSTEESSRRDLTLVHINLAVENALSASTEVGGTVNKYL